MSTFTSKSFAVPPGLPDRIRTGVQSNMIAGDWARAYMTKMRLTRVAFLVLLLISCIGPTDSCACLPPPFNVSVQGVIRNANGAPLANTRYYLLARRANGELGSAPAARDALPKSDADGRFGMFVTADSDGPHDVVAAVYVTATPVIVEMGQMSFAAGGGSPVDRDIRLPAPAAPSGSSLRSGLPLAR